MARYLTPFAQAFDTSGNTIAGAELNFFEEGTTTPRNTYTDDTLGTPNSNPVIADGGGFFPNIFLENATYTVLYTDADQVTIKTADVDGTGDALISSFISSAGVSGTDPDGLSQAVARYAVSGAMFYTDNGAADAYVLVAKGDFIIPDTLLDGWLVRFRPSNTNTGATTVNINSLGVKDIVTPAGVALVGGELTSGEDASITYDLANDRFEIPPVGFESVTGTGVDNADPLNPIVKGFPLIHVQQKVSSGVQGGSTVTGYQTRVLNTVIENDITGASLSSNEIILADGDYYIDASCPAMFSQSTRAEFFNVSDATPVFNGPTTHANTTVCRNNLVSGDFTVSSGPKNFSLRMFAQSVKATDGLGIAASSGQDEVYADVKIWKVSD